MVFSILSVITGGGFIIGFILDIIGGASTLRVTNKEGRPPQRLVAFLEGYEETEVPERLVHVIYDTGIEKRGRVIKIG